MKFLFLNNYHYMRGGSERVYFGEMAMLQDKGHSVQAFARLTEYDQPSQFHCYFPPDIKTDSVTIGLRAFRTIKEIVYSLESKKQLGLVLKKFKPNIAHAHNIYGRLTTSVLDLLRQNEVPIVMTLHDYKLICPSYLLSYDNHVCEDCKGGRYYHAILNRCHKNSVAASGIYAFEAWFNDHFKKYRKNVNYFISPSHFLRNKLIEFGWPSEKIVYIPNYICSADYKPEFMPGDYFVYIGRLSGEKGLDTLIQSFKQISEINCKLIIVGDGPERKKLEQLARDDYRIQFKGHLSGKALCDATRYSKAVIVPSICYENAPMTILEAFSFGKPVIGANIGGIPEMIDDRDDGFLFNPGDIDDLTDKLRLFFNYSEKKIIQMGRKAREKVEKKFNPNTHYEHLMELYRNMSTEATVEKYLRNDDT